MRFLDTHIPVPLGVHHASDLAPALHALSDAMVVEQVARLGPVSCAPSCAACCRQLAPLAEPEMHALARAIEGLEPGHRERVLARFEAAVERLEEEGLANTLRSPPTDPAAYRDMLSAYQDLRLACPLLEESRCAIYAQRPCICREHAVRSPPEHCDDPLREPVVRVDTRGHVAMALAGVLGRPQGPTVKITPLVLALEWAASHPEAELPAPAEQVLTELVRTLEGTG